jgi:hypothetical protein
MATVGGPLDDFQDRLDLDSLNLNVHKSIKLVNAMRYESADFKGPAAAVSAAVRPYIQSTHAYDQERADEMRKQNTAFCCRAVLLSRFISYT